MKPPEETWAEYVARKKTEATVRGWCEEVVADPGWLWATPRQRIRREIEEYAKDPRLIRAVDGNFYLRETT